VTERILLCDNSPTIRAALAEALRFRGWTVVEAASRAEIDEALSARRFDIALIDAEAVGPGAQDLPSGLARLQPDLDVVLMTHSAGEGGIAALGRGAADYLLRPFRVEELELRLLRLRRDREHRRELERLRAILYASWRLRGFSGESSSTRVVWERAHLFADQTAPVLITGEHGTGKKLVAAAIHELGRRRAGPFVTIRCLDRDRDLSARVRGAVENADGGTLLLHDVDGCDSAVQERLGFFLSNGRLPDAEHGERDPPDVRIVATTTADLAVAVDEGRFREDLRVLLQRLEIQLPALRRRGDDILVLAREFLRTWAERQRQPPKTLSPEAAAALGRYGWPGNVTELHQMLAAASATARTQVIELGDLPGRLTDARAAQLPFSLHLDGPLAIALPELVARLERELVEWALGRSRGDLRRAAEILGVPEEVVASWRERGG
jgi:DNA-binding NtrC family response regulator